MLSSKSCLIRRRWGGRRMQVSEKQDKSILGSDQFEQDRCTILILKLLTEAKQKIKLSLSLREQSMIGSLRGS